VSFIENSAGDEVGGGGFEGDFTATNGVTKIVANHANNGAGGIYVGIDGSFTANWFFSGNTTNGSNGGTTPNPDPATTDKVYYAAGTPSPDISSLGGLKGEVITEKSSGGMWIDDGGSATFNTPFTTLVALDGSGNLVIQERDLAPIGYEEVKLMGGDDDSSLLDLVNNYLAELLGDELGNQVPLDLVPSAFEGLGSGNGADNGAVNGDGAGGSSADSDDSNAHHSEVNTNSSS
jgi:hypothetical protein